MNGFIPTGTFLGGVNNVIRYFDGGGTFTQNDLVKFSSGELVVATAGDAFVGVALTDGTASSVDVGVNVTPGLLGLMDNDNDTDTFDSANVGDHFDITGATGAHQIDTSTADTTGQLICTQYNPQGHGFDDDESIGEFMFSENIYQL